MLGPGGASAALVVLGWLAQGEPAASPSVGDPGAPSAVDHAPASAVSFHARLATRPAAPDGGGPHEGFSLGGAFERRYASLGQGRGAGLALGAGLDLFFDRFASGVTQNSFVALQTFTLERVPVRPWLAAGLGLAVAGGARAVVRGALGLSYPITRDIAVALRADLTHALSGDKALGDLVDAGLGLVQRF